MIMIAFLLLGLACVILASTMDKPHGHKGVLDFYDGSIIPLKLTGEQEAKLTKGEHVSFNERVGKSGRGVVVQDVQALPSTCMSKIRDLSNYVTMVPNVKKVQIYDTIKHANGTTKTFAKFDVGALGMRFGYFLALTFEPKVNTLTWTLDYRYNSDFDDNVGHWQVLPHPSKKGWTRILYSTKVKLFPWIPEFIVNFLTKTALVQSTTWVRKESEQEQKRLESLQAATASPKGKCWMRIEEIKAKTENFVSNLDKNRNNWASFTPKFKFFKGT